tara:strand:- start:2135 stop:3661 length:1527 start_codon:yes stop_codon:yes gene_type:complete
MTYKHNIDDSARGYYYASNGDDSWDGRSLENPKKTMQAALNAANALIPPPSSGPLASVKEGEGGIYFESLVLFERVVFEGFLSSIVTSGPVGVLAASTMGFSAQALVSTSTGQTLLKVDGEEQFSARVSSMTLGGDGAKGIEIIGNNSGIFFNFSEVRINGLGATVVDYQGNSLIPADFNFNTIVFGEDNQTFFNYQPTSPQDTVDINVSSMHFETGVTGSVGFLVGGGVLKVRGGSFGTETFAQVGVAGTLSVSCNVIGGDTLADGSAVYDTVGVIFGNLETSVTGTILWRGTSITGDLTNAGNASIICTKFDGEIVNTGQMYVQIGSYLGTMPANDGSINGIINGVRYGNWGIALERILRGASYSAQNPAGKDTPLQIEFGAAQSPLLDVNGTFTPAEDGQYRVKFFLQYGRSGSGNVSWMLFYLELDGLQIGDTALAKLDGANDDVPAEFNFAIDMTAGQELKAYVLRDSQGNNSGGLISETPTIAINDIPSAVITIERIKNSYP